MRTFFRSVWVVARYELADSMRSRRAVVVLLLYLAGAVIACNGFLTVLHRLEIELADTLGIDPARNAGVVAERVWESEMFRGMIVSLAGDEKLAQELLANPLIALFYGWLAFTFTPVLVMLTTPSRIAEETSSGSVRFVLVRTSRPAWCLGKFLGQAALIFLALILSALGAWCLAKFKLTHVDDLLVAKAMLIYAGKAWIYALPFIGIGLGVSQLTRSPNKATVFGFLTWFVLIILFWVSYWYGQKEGGEMWTLVTMIVPQGHRMDLWRMDAGHVVSGITFLVAQSLVYLSVGYLFFSRKDM